MLRSDFIVLASIETPKTNRQRELLDLTEAGSFGSDKVCEMGQVMTGEHPGRTSDQQIIYYKSNSAVGIHFAAPAPRSTSRARSVDWAATYRRNGSPQSLLP